MLRSTLTCLVLAGCIALGCHPRAAATGASSPPTACAPALAPGDHQHDFDFEFGAWTAKLSRRLRPLTGSEEWVAYEGTSVVHPLWGGKANARELDVSGTAGRIEGLTLRLYDPATRQWTVRFANSRDGGADAGSGGRLLRGAG